MSCELHLAYDGSLGYVEVSIELCSSCTFSKDTAHVVAQNNSKAATKKFPKTSNPSFVYEVKDTATDMRSDGRCTNSDFPAPLYNLRHILSG